LRSDWEIEANAAEWRVRSRMRDSEISEMRVSATVPMSNTLFSIVIPSLNATPYLDRALRSVLIQAGDDTEVLVVDGGSTDGSVEIIRRHERQLAW